MTAGIEDPLTYVYRGAYCGLWRAVACRRGMSARDYSRGSYPYTRHQGGGLLPLLVKQTWLAAHLVPERGSVAQAHQDCNDPGSMTSIPPAKPVPVTIGFAAVAASAWPSNPE